MHEYGIAQQMVQVALDYAVESHAARITQFNVEMSATADESEDSLIFYFEMLTRGTLAQGARVEITRVPVPARCLECGKEFIWHWHDNGCPRCSSPHFRAYAHEDFRLASIDVE